MNNCCGNCCNFDNEDTNGIGYCSEHDTVKLCSDYCEWWVEYTGSYIYNEEYNGGQ